MLLSWKFWCYGSWFIIILLNTCQQANFMFLCVNNDLILHLWRRSVTTVVYSAEKFMLLQLSNLLFFCFDFQQAFCQKSGISYLLSICTHHSLPRSSYLLLVQLYMVFSNTCRTKIWETQNDDFLNTRHLLNSYWLIVPCTLIFINTGLSTVTTICAIQSLYFTGCRLGNLVICVLIVRNTVSM